MYLIRSIPSQITDDAMIVKPWDSIKENFSQPNAAARLRAQRYSRAAFSTLDGAGILPNATTRISAAYSQALIICASTLLETT